MVAVESSATPYEIRSITYKVESASLPGVVYTVTVDENGWTCSCKAGEFTKTRGRCWHLKAAQNGELGKPRMRVCPLPPAPRSATCPHGRRPGLCAACAGPASVSDLYA